MKTDEELKERVELCYKISKGEASFLELIESELTEEEEKNFNSYL